MALEPATTATLMKLGVELLTRATPKGIAWFTQWFKGKKILIIGQPRAGKTSFVKYLRYGTFTSPEIPMPRTREIKKTAAFTVSMGRDQALKLEVNKAIDTVGQVTADEHVRNIVKFKPEAIIIFLDLDANWKGTDEYSAGFYLEEFFIHFSEVLNKTTTIKDKIESLTIVLNKTDKVSPDKVKAWRANIKKCLRDRLLNSYGSKTNEIAIMESSLIESNGGKLPDAIITQLALELTKHNG